MITIYKRTLKPSPKATGQPHSLNINPHFIAVDFSKSTRTLTQENLPSLLQADFLYDSTLNSTLANSRFDLFVVATIEHLSDLSTQYPELFI
jgi:hypothetical protein